LIEALIRITQSELQQQDSLLWKSETRMNDLIEIAFPESGPACMVSFTHLPCTTSRLEVMNLESMQSMFRFSNMHKEVLRRIKAREFQMAMTLIRFRSNTQLCI
jgi:hypothetical protein